jgi:hypothetical protein
MPGKDRNVGEGPESLNTILVAKSNGRQREQPKRHSKQEIMSHMKDGRKLDPRAKNSDLSVGVVPPRESEGKYNMVHRKAQEKEMYALEEEQQHEKERVSTRAREINHAVHRIYACRRILRREPRPKRLDWHKH